MKVKDLLEKIKNLDPEQNIQLSDYETKKNERYFLISYVGNNRNGLCYGDIVIQCSPPLFDKKGIAKFIQNDKGMELINPPVILNVFELTEEDYIACVQK